MVRPYNQNNPIGYVYSIMQLKDISELVIKNDIMVFANECYDRIVFNDEFTKKLGFGSIAALSGMKERTITVKEIIKSYNHSGLQVAWLFSDKKNMEVMAVVQPWATRSSFPLFKIKNAHHT